MLLDQLQWQYKQAMLARDTDSKEALNSVISAIKNKRIELQRDLDDTDMIQVLQKEIKLRREGAGFLLNAGKQEQYDSEMKKITILEQFLPTMLDIVALQAAVKKNNRHSYYYWSSKTKRRSNQTNQSRSWS
jgi:uncharacterized protein YqeY